jgi:hypothetical protein
MPEQHGRQLVGQHIVSVPGKGDQQFLVAAKKGVSAEVVISNGIATTIRDDH